MSSGSLSAVAWYTGLEPVAPEEAPRRPDDPRLGEATEFWQGDAAALRFGRAVLIGFPHDEGVRRNGGRVGAAQAPAEIRRWLYRLTPLSAPLLDAGNVRWAGSLEATQTALGEVVAGCLSAGAVPVVLGGGHETAFGHYLGYAAGARAVGIINLDAHLDVRPLLAAGGHSGSPFRQALEHPHHPLGWGRYVCLGAQPQSVSAEHLRYAREHGGVVEFASQLEPSLEEHFVRQRDRLVQDGCQVYVSLDADVVRMADMPGVSAPNPSGLSGFQVLNCMRQAGASPAITSCDVVEINPVYDRDGQSARWAAVAIWNFLLGLTQRPEKPPCPPG